MIIGHETIVSYLEKSAQNGQIAHAYLFVGPKQVGKMTVAQWFASILLCHPQEGASLFAPSTKDKTAKPCQACLSCRSFKQQKHQDFFLLEKPEDKQQISVEQIKGALSFLQTSASLASRKILLINQADTLSHAAANAFLKTLEETPATHSIILLSDQPQSLLATIVSRCQVIEFNRVFKTSQKEISSEGLAQAQGLPGLYSSRLAEPALEMDQQREAREFADILDLSKGERLLAIDRYFDKKKGHALAKEDWAKRLPIWKSVLRGIIIKSAQQGSPNLKAVASADAIMQLEANMKRPVNLRAQIERFFLEY